MISWSVDPIIFQMGPLQVRWYGLLFLTGFLLGLRFMRTVCAEEKKSPLLLDTLLIYLIAGTTIGARLGHCLFYEWSYYKDHLLEILQIWQGGLASHGGGAGVIAALFLFSRLHREFSFSWLCDRISVPLALTGVGIRMGNLMNSEIVGKPTAVPWAFVFERLDQIPRHPTPIYEGLWYLMTWFVGFRLYRKFKGRTPQGLLFGWTVMSIFTGRILIEFLKENQEPFEKDWTLNMGQWLSVPWLLLGAFFFFRAVRKATSLSRQKARL